MKYFEEMLDSHGFGKGKYVPVDARERRAVYVKAINANAEELGSSYRAREFDRPSTYRKSNNFCQIIFEHIETGEVGSDDNLQRAIEHARQLDLDRCIQNTVEVDDDMVEWLIIKGYSPGQSETDEYLRQRLAEP